MLDKIAAHLKHASLKIKLPTYISQLNQLEEQWLQAATSFSTNKPGLKILMGPSFSIHEPCFAHDRLLSLALRLRGATIIPTYCDQLQEQECNVYGGRWMGTTFKKACASCMSFSWQQWPHKYFKPEALSSHISAQAKLKIEQLLKALGQDEWADYQEEGMPLGLWAKDILVNNYMVGDYHLIENAEFLGKMHLKNLLYLKIAYENLLIKVKPDRVISNDSYYGMWAVLEHVCKKLGIDHYSHWYGGRKDGWCYAYQDAAMNLNFRKPWPVFSQKSLTEDEYQKVDRWVRNRVYGEDMVFNSASIAAHQTDAYSAEILNSQKPKALLCANVIWDCAALNKQLLFEDMNDWIAKTVEWFAKHPEYELIIKPHPSEENPIIPRTVETVKMGLEQRGITLPANVHLLSAKVKLSVYELFPVTTVGLMHTTTVGIEMAARGIPVVTTAKSPYRGFGFTIDPTSQDEYFSALEGILSNAYQIDKNKQLDLAYKFIYFYQFHYYSKIGIMNFEFGKVPTVLINGINQLKPGNNAAFDYFVDAIMAGRPMLTENSWMPAT